MSDVGLRSTPSTSRRSEMWEVWFRLPGQDWRLYSNHHSSLDQALVARRAVATHLHPDPPTQIRRVVAFEEILDV